ncbi:hypothetical protein [Syntrophomonas curvata]
MEALVDKIYEEGFKNQPLYRNKFHLGDKERTEYLHQVPSWVYQWQKELDRIYAD